MRESAWAKRLYALRLKTITLIGYYSRKGLIMSNLDWFQELYDAHNETFFSLLQEAQKHNCTLRLSLSPDGTVIFTGTNSEMTKTIVQDSESITYRQMKETNNDV